MAFDTATPVGSVAVEVDGDVRAASSLDEQGRHAAALVPALDDTLRRAGRTPAEITDVVVGEGPGSFTGVRVAAATAKGLGRALGCRVWAVPSPAAAALAVGRSGVWYVLFDARADRIYGACYGVGAAKVEELVPPHGGTVRDVLSGDLPVGVAFCGQGAVLHRVAIEAAGFPVVDDAGLYPTAEGLLAYRTRVPGLEPVSDLAAWEPRYVRPWRPDASWKG